MRVLFSGDVQQTLSVILIGTIAEEIRASFKSSFIWSNIKKSSLTVNMRVQLKEGNLLGEFSKISFTKLGNGQILETSTGDIKILHNLANFVTTV